MTERDLRLVKEFGPRFIARSRHIFNECNYIAADAYSVMTDEEWKICAEAMTKFLNEMNKISDLVNSRINEAVGGDEDKYLELYVNAKKNLEKFSSY